MRNNREKCKFAKLPNTIACQKLIIYSIPGYIGSMLSTKYLPQAVLALMACWIGRWVVGTG